MEESTYRINNFVSNDDYYFSIPCPQSKFSVFIIYFEDKRFINIIHFIQFQLLLSFHKIGPTQNTPTYCYKKLHLNLRNLWNVKLNFHNYTWKNIRCLIRSFIIFVLNEMRFFISTYLSVAISFLFQSCQPHNTPHLGIPKSHLVRLFGISWDSCVVIIALLNQYVEKPQTVDGDEANLISWQKLKLCMCYWGEHQDKLALITLLW